MALGDLDGDGDIDAFVSNDTANTVWLNDGSANFTGTGQTLGSYDSRRSSLGDLDGDGDLDAFCVNWGFNLVWINDGSGGFNDSGQREAGQDVSIIKTMTIRIISVNRNQSKIGCFRRFSMAPARLPGIARCL